MRAGDSCGDPWLGSRGAAGEPLLPAPAQPSSEPLVATGGRARGGSAAAEHDRGAAASSASTNRLYSHRPRQLLGTQAFTPGRLRAHWPCCHLTGDPSWAWNGLDGRGLSVVASWVLVLTRPALPGLLGGDPSATRTHGGQGHGNEQHTFPVCAGPPSHPAPQSHWLCSTWGRCGLEDHAGTCQRRGRGWGSRDSGHPLRGATPSAGDPEALASPVVGGTHASI